MREPKSPLWIKITVLLLTLFTALPPHPPLPQLLKRILVMQWRKFFIILSSLSKTLFSVSFYNPKLERANGYPKGKNLSFNISNYNVESTVIHEVAKERSFARHSPQRLNSPKRDPILLNNNEPVLVQKMKVDDLNLT